MPSDSGGIQYQFDLIQLPTLIPSDSTGIQLNSSLIRMKHNFPTKV